MGLQSVSNAIEVREPVIATSDRFPIYDARSRWKACKRLDNEREAIGEIVTRPAVEPHPLPILRAITRKPSHLISCSHIAPEGGCAAFTGRHGAMKPAGRARGC